MAASRPLAGCSCRTLGPTTNADDTPITDNAITRARRLARRYFRRWQHRGDCVCTSSHFLQSAYPATVGSARVAVWPRLVCAVLRHGSGRMAGLARAQLQRRPRRVGSLRHSAHRQRTLDLAILRAASRRALLGRNRCALAAHRGNHL